MVVVQVRTKILLLGLLLILASGPNSTLAGETPQVEPLSPEKLHQPQVHLEDRIQEGEKRLTPEDIQNGLDRAKELEKEMTIEDVPAGNLSEVDLVELGTRVAEEQERQKRTILPKIAKNNPWAGQKQLEALLEKDHSVQAKTALQGEQLLFRLYL